MYYFLDVDGVLNKKSDWKRPFTVNSECVRNFKRLMEQDKESHVILSSTWRQGVTNTGVTSERDDSLIKMFDNFGNVFNKVRTDDLVKLKNLINDTYFEGKPYYYDVLAISSECVFTVDQLYSIYTDL